MIHYNSILLLKVFGVSYSVKIFRLNFRTHSTTLTCVYMPSPPHSSFHQRSNIGHRYYIISIIIMALQPFVGTRPLFQFILIIYTVFRTPWTGDQPVARPLPTQRTTQTQNKKHTIQISMHWVGIEATIPAFERAKTVHALDCAATVIMYIMIV
jgi:hypothetical protein